MGGILQDPDTKRVAFAEIIGVVLDEDAPSAPVGIPTCPHTAFVTEPAGIFLSFKTPQQASHYIFIIIAFVSEGLDFFSSGGSV